MTMLETAAKALLVAAMWSVALTCVLVVAAISLLVLTFAFPPRP